MRTGEKAGYVPQDLAMKAKAIMLTTAAEDLRSDFVRHHRCLCPWLKPSWSGKMAKYLQGFEHELECNRGGIGFFVGDEISFADITIFDVLESIVCWKVQWCRMECWR